MVINDGMRFPSSLLPVLPFMLCSVVFVDAQIHSYFRGSLWYEIWMWGTILVEKPNRQSLLCFARIKVPQNALVTIYKITLTNAAC